MAVLLYYQFKYCPYRGVHVHVAILNHMLTNNSLDVRAFQSSQSQISNLDQSRRAVDEDVVTLEISVDDGLTPSVQEVETAQDLTTPATNHLGLDGLQTTHVST